VHAGDRLGFHGEGFAPRQRVQADLRSFAVLLGTFRADRHGEVDGTVTIPRRTRSGFHHFELIARYPHRKCSVGIKVLRKDNRALTAGPVNTTTYDDKQPEHAGLANTGSEKALALGAAAAGLIAAGGGTMLAVRRRRSS
jgi:LPXTG-motif cell wall-anchored protein